MRKKRKFQLRRCQFCNKPGHNKATCPEFLVYQREICDIEKNKQIKIFYHKPEQKNSDTVSPYLINIKNKINHWQNVETISPEETEKTQWEKFYEEIKKPEKDINDNHELQLLNSSIVINNDEKLDEKLIDDDEKKEKTIKTKDENSRNSYVISDFQNFAEKLKDDIRNSGNKEEIIKENINKISYKLSFLGNSLFNKKLIWRKALTLGMVSLIILGLPLQGHTFYKNLKVSTDKIATNGNEGFMALQDSTAAIINADLPTAQNSIIEALQNFNIAIEEIQNHKILQKIISEVPILKNEVQSRQSLILAGQKIALANTYLIKGISQSSDENVAPLERLNILSIHLKAAIPNYESAFGEINKIKIEVLPFEYQSSFKDFTLLFKHLLSDLKNISDLIQSINEIFNNTILQRYLLVFQNEAELRATGGFVGSFAVVEIKNGKIEKIEIPAGGSYDLQGQLTVLVEPPPPLLLSNKKWEFQDANWFPDFKASAEKILWFYQHSRNTTLDGVIAINSSVLQRLLSLIGPITDQKRNLVLNEKNALITLQTIVETGPEKKENRPKQIISDLAPQFLSSIFSLEPKNTLPFLFSLNEALSQKEIQVYFSAPSLQKIIEYFGWGGRLIETPPNKDYLMVVNNNIQGQKSDAWIKQKIYHQALVEEDGTIINSVTITRIHEGIAGQNLYGQPNIDYLKVYVPKGSELISASGFVWPDEKYFKAPAKGAVKDKTLLSLEKEVGFDEVSGTRITEEFNKTVFSNWIITDPGTKSIVQFVYRLPFKAFSTEQNSNKNILNHLLDINKTTSQYQLIIQRQSGCNSTFESQVIYPNNFEPVWNAGENSNLALNGYFVPETPLKKDAVWSLLMEKKINK